MKQFEFKRLLPHLIAIAIFIIVAIVYCKPAFDGKVVAQHDTQGWRGMSQQSVEFHDKHGYYPLWTNSMFSGMPAYQIAFDAKTHIQIGYLSKILTLGLPQPVNFFFLACLCFYILCIVLRVNPWVGIMGSIAYAYSTFDPIIIAVGHNTQMMSIGYAPAVFAGLLLLFEKKYWSGFAITSFFSVLLIGENHLQMVYYTLLIAAVITLIFIIHSFRQKKPGGAVKPALLGLLAGLLGLACNAVVMMPTYEYAKETMRGGRSELTRKNDNGNKTKGGLDKDYAFKYSVGIPETFTLMVPSVYGGSNGGREQSTDSKFAGKLSEAGEPEDNALQMANGYSYWGMQQPTSGPVYLGVIICFLFIFGLIYLNSWHKWWIVSVALLGILLAWGSNFSAFNYFLFDHLPFYNKFRAPSFALFMPQLAFPLMAVLGISQLITETIWSTAWKKLRIATIITGIIFLVIGAFYLSASFTGPSDKDLKENFKQGMLRQVPQGQQPSPQMEEQANNFSKDLITALHTDRKDLLGGDLFRNLVLVIIAIVLIGLFIRKKINPIVLIASLTVLISYDIISIDKRYLGTENFQEDTEFESAFTPTATDEQIMKDPDHANFRVFNRTVDVFNDASTSFHHNSIGGYHPAKLALYQDIIENQLSKGNMQVYNMLNTKYFIVQNPSTGKEMAQMNPGAFGNCWLVKGIKWVNNADEDMQALDSTNLRDTAVIENRYKSKVQPGIQYDSAASIKLKENLNDDITYSYNASTPQFAVFSEIYYPLGWKVFIDGKQSDYVCTNYLLRGMSLPSGKHEIEFKFEPSSFTTGRMITIWANISIALIILFAIFMWYKDIKPGSNIKRS